MPSRRKIPENIQNRVRQRANSLCEYCHASEQWQYVKFTIEHIIPLTKNGTDDIDNLALACFHCNRKKSDRTTAIEPQSGVELPLYSWQATKIEESITIDRNRVAGSQNELLPQSPLPKAAKS